MHTKVDSPRLYIVVVEYNVELEGRTARRMNSVYMPT